MLVAITAPAGSHIPAAMRALLESGWTIQRAPVNGRLLRNGQRVVLRSADGDARFRLFVYKVTGSGRGSPDERRIEITSTYQKGLRRLAGYPDVVLGYDATHRIFVGVDAARIGHGGPTGNASSFFDRRGLEWKHVDRILLRPRAARLFPGGIEYHAFLKSARLAEYL